MGGSSEEESKIDEVGFISGSLFECGESSIFDKKAYSASENSIDEEERREVMKRAFPNDLSSDQDSYPELSNLSSQDIFEERKGESLNPQMKQMRERAFQRVRNNSNFSSKFDESSRRDRTRSRDNRKRGPHW